MPQLIQQQQFQAPNSLNKALQILQLKKALEPEPVDPLNQALKQLTVDTARTRANTASLAAENKQEELAASKTQLSEDEREALIADGIKLLPSITDQASLEQANGLLNRKHPKAQNAFMQLFNGQYSDENKALLENFAEKEKQGPLTFEQRKELKRIGPKEKGLSQDAIRKRLISLNKGLVQIRANKGLDPLTIALLGDKPEALKALQGGDTKAAEAEFTKQIKHFNTRLNKATNVPKAGTAQKVKPKITDEQRTGGQTTPTGGPIRRKILKDGSSINVVQTAINPQTGKRLYNTGTVWVDDEGVVWQVVQ